MSHALVAAFPVVIEFDVGWSDMDAYEHVSNLEYFRFFQNANPDNVTPPPGAATTTYPETPLVEEPAADSPVLTETPTTTAPVAPAETAPATPSAQ